MAGFDPSIIKEAVNDPGIAMQMAGLMIPNITRHSPYGTTTLKPGQVLSTLGQGYEGMKSQKVLGDLQQDTAKKVVTSTTPPWQQPDTIGMSTNPIGTDANPGTGTMTMDSKSYTDKAQWKPQVPIYADIVANMSPEQAKYALGRGGGLNHTTVFSPIFDSLTKGAHERVATEQAKLLDQAIMKYRTDPSDTDAENAIMLLSSAPNVGAVGGGTEKVNQMRLMMQRDSYMKFLDGMGNLDDRANMSKYAGAPDLLKERVTYLLKRKQDAEQGGKIVEQLRGKIPDEQFNFWMNQANQGIVPTPEVMANLQESGNAMRFYNRNSGAMSDVGTGLPLSKLQLAALDRDPDMTPGIRADIMKKQQAAIVHQQEGQKIAISEKTYQQTERARDLQDVQVHRMDAQNLQQELQATEHIASAQNWPKAKLISEQNRVMAKYLHASEAADLAKQRYYTKWDRGTGLGLEARGDNTAMKAFTSAQKQPDTVLGELDAYRQDLESRKEYLYQLGPLGISHYNNMVNQYGKIRADWEAKKAAGFAPPPDPEVPGGQPVPYSRRGPSLQPPNSHGLGKFGTRQDMEEMQRLSPPNPNTMVPPWAPN